ncbi:unnamed protein product [Auanema sp. JU1783]|nr:unnamed protein product [Auanema sp. JU1783]
MSSFALYGTEFEALDADTIGVPRKPAAIQDQIATDENGRRRFHGAFTGGFSAGYFNTVGTKEGWTPQEFRSTKEERALTHQMRPEDLMDEEDLGEFGISARRIQKSQAFGGGGQSTSSQKRRFAWEHDSSSVSSLTERIETMVRPTHESVGVQMLKAMGWREGRGVGLATNRQIRERGGSSKEADFDRKQAAKIAPGYQLALEDEILQHLTPVEGVSGLGYKGLRETAVLDEGYGQLEAALKTKSRSKGIRGQAFGVGVFENDDESVYSNYDLTQYDFSIGGPAQKIEAPEVDCTFEEMPKRLNSRKFYPPPKLPPNFRAHHKIEAIDVKKLPEMVQSAMKNLSVVQRARLLGEDRISVMELVGSKDRKTLEKARERQRSRWDMTDEELIESEQKINVDRIVFPDEPMKQRRFKEFLNYLRRGLPYMQPTDMSVWEWEAEKKDFEEKLTPDERGMLPEVRSRSQPLVKTALSLPILEIMQNKFTKETGTSGNIGRKDEDKLAAVKVGIFGDKTRTTFEWYPDSLLSKRFNVPHPYPGSKLVGVPHLQKPVKRENVMNLGLPTTATQVFQSQPDVIPIEDIKKEEGFDEENVEESVEKPPQSIFDAIFAEFAVSSSDSESEDDDEDVRKKKEVKEEPEDDYAEEKPSTYEPRSQEKVMTVMDLDQEYGPAPPTSMQANDNLTASTVLRYLEEEIARKKAEKKKKKKSKSHKEHKDHKSKKSKKEKKSKKSKKEHKKKHKKEKSHKKRSRSNSSGSSSSWSSGGSGSDSD